jgi:hypothetical protein
MQREAAATQDEPAYAGTPTVRAGRARSGTGGAGAGAYMGIEAGGCGRKVTGFYVWGWEFLTALLLFSASSN